MNNVDFSKEGRLILRNPKLRDHLLKRTSNLTPEEKEKGFITIRLKKDGHLYDLNFRIAPDSNFDYEATSKQNSHKPELI